MIYVPKPKEAISHSCREYCRQRDEWDVLALERTHKQTPDLAKEFEEYYLNVWIKEQTHDLHTTTSGNPGAGD